MVQADAYVRQIRGHTHSVFETWQLLESLCPLAHLKRNNSPEHIPEKALENFMRTNS